MVDGINPNEFYRLEDFWKELETGMDMTFFQSYEWFKILNSHFLSERRKDPFRSGEYVVAFSNEGKPLMIAPVMVVKRGFSCKGIGMRSGFYIIGRQGYSDYMNFIYSDFFPGALEEIIEYLVKKYKLGYFCLENIPKKSKMGIYLDKIEDIKINESLCMVLTLPETYDEYLGMLSKNFRSNLNKAFNHAARDGKDFKTEVVRKIDPETAAILTKLASGRLMKKKHKEFHDMSMGSKIYSVARKIIIKVFNNNFNIMRELEDCWCLVIKEKANIAAFIFCAYSPIKKTAYYLLSGLNNEYEAYWPIISNLCLYFKEEISRNKPELEVLDLTRGNERYKYDLRADEVITCKYEFTR